MKSPWKHLLTLTFSAVALEGASFADQSLPLKCVSPDQKYRFAFYAPFKDVSQDSSIFLQFLPGSSVPGIYGRTLKAAGEISATKFEVDLYTLYSPAGPVPPQSAPAGYLRGELANGAWSLQYRKDKNSPVIDISCI